MCVCFSFRTLPQVSDLVEQVESLRVAVRSRDITLGRYTEEVERSRAELRELRVLQDRLAAREKKLEEARDRQREADALYQKALQVMCDDVVRWYDAGGCY